ncbi:MAG: hypothetical protein F6K47_25805 [Symploca sp. SIO2E6]|nr:hypothetical protein [Symploca sp. SIO2E6]
MITLEKHRGRRLRGSEAGGEGGGRRFQGGRRYITYYLLLITYYFKTLIRKIWLHFKQAISP